MRAFTSEIFISKRARGSNVAALYPPDITYPFSVTLQAIFPSVEEVLKLNKTVKLCMEISETGLIFAKLDLDSAVCAAFFDIGLTTNNKYFSQLGFIIVLMNKKY